MFTHIRQIPCDVVEQSQCRRNVCEMKIKILGFCDDKIECGEKEIELNSSSYTSNVNI